MPGTIWERIRRQDKGTMLIEATFSIGLAGLFGLGVTNAQLASNETQRTSSNFSIAAQLAQGTLEKAKSTPWPDLGTDPTKTAVGDSMLPAGITSVRVGKLLPQTADTVRMLKLTTLVTVGWVQRPAGTTYGTKMVIVKTTWQDREGDPTTTHSHTEQTTITPGVGEAPPSSVHGDGGGASAVTPPPVAPTPYPTYSAPPAPTATSPAAPVASPTPTPTPTPPPTVVLSPIDIKYNQVGSAVLGSPTSAETGGLPRGGRYRNYTNGQIIWQPDIGAVALMSSAGIVKRFNAEGGVTGTFGYPLQDEQKPSTDTATQNFENGEDLYKSSLGDAYLPNGVQRNYFLSSGGTGTWGFPSTEMGTGLRDGGTYQRFENAWLMWSPNVGPSQIKGAIRDEWASEGYENGPLGYPIGGEYYWNSSTRMDFENGYMLYTTSGGVEVH